MNKETIHEIGKTHGAAIGGYLLLAVILTWPMTAHLGSQIASEPLDPSVFMWVLDENFKSIGQGFASYLDGDIFFPEKDTLLYAETFSVISAFLWPFHLCGFSVIACYNIFCLFSFVLAGYALWLVVYDFTNNVYVSFVGGTIFAFSSFHILCLNRPQILCTGLLILAFRHLYLYLQNWNWRHLAGYIVISLLLLGCSLQYVFLNCFLFLGLVGIIGGLRFSQLTMRRFLEIGGTILILGAAYFAVIKLYVPIWANQQAGERTIDYLYELTSTTIAHYIWPNWRNMYHTLIPVIHIPVTDVGFSPGFLSLILATIAGWTYWPSRWKTENPKRRKIAHWILGLGSMYAVLIVYCVITGGILHYIGPLKISIHNPHRLQFQFFLFAIVWLFLYFDFNKIKAEINNSPTFFLPVVCILALIGLLCSSMYPLRWITEPFESLSYFRTHARFGIFVLAGISILSAMGFHRVLEKVDYERKYPVFSFIAAFLVIMECWPGIQFSQPPTNQSIEPVYGWLNNQGGITVIAEFPAESKEHKSRYLLNSLYHKKKMVNGYAWNQPPWYDEFTNAMMHFPDVSSIRLLRDRQAEVVLVHGQLMEGKAFQRINEQASVHDSLQIVYEDEHTIAVRIIKLESRME